MSRAKHLGFYAHPTRGNSGVDSDSDPEKSGPALSAAAPAAPVAPVAPAAYTEVQPEALVERTEAVGDGDRGDRDVFFWWVSQGFPKYSKDVHHFAEIEDICREWMLKFSGEVNIWQWQSMVISPL